MAISLGSGMLAAALLLGQGQEIPTSGRPSIFGGFSQPTQTQSRGIFPWFSRSDDRPVMNKLQGWFSRKEQQSDVTSGSRRGGTAAPPLQSAPTIIEGTPTSNPSSVIPTNPTPIEFPRKLPNPQGQGPAPAQFPVTAVPTSSKSVQQTTLDLATSTPSPILPQLANKIGRDEKFEWITGQLEIEAGGFVLYYATPETVDTYKGRISLHPQQIDMSSYRRGDLVSVRGELTQRPGAQGRTPIYRLTDIQMLERVK